MAPADDAEDGAGVIAEQPAREKPIKISAKIISQRRHVSLQMAGAAVLQQTFADIPSLIARLRAPPVLA